MRRDGRAFKLEPMRIGRRDVQTSKPERLKLDKLGTVDVERFLQKAFVDW